MLITDHAPTAEGYLADSDREYDAGDTLQASEKLWGAAAHAIMAVAQHVGWIMAPTARWSMPPGQSPMPWTVN